VRHILARELWKASCASPSTTWALKLLAYGRGSLGSESAGMGHLLGMQFQDLSGRSQAEGTRKISTVLCIEYCTVEVCATKWHIPAVRNKAAALFIAAGTY